MAEAAENGAGDPRGGAGNVDVMEKLRGFSKLLRRGEIALALGLICILTVLIIPMPSWMLDISLALSITVSVLILMVVLFIEKPLDFSTFPTILLIVTML